MLRDELETALNDLIVAARETADGYDTAAGIVEERELAALLCEARERCRAAAAGLEDEQRRLGHLPKAKDEDYILARDLATQVKATLAEDDAVPALRERCADESRIVQACEALLALDPPASLQQVTRHLRGQAEAMRRRLQAQVALE